MVLLPRKVCLLVLALMLGGLGSPCLVASEAGEFLSRLRKDNPGLDTGKVKFRPGRRGSLDISAVEIQNGQALKGLEVRTLTVSRIRFDGEVLAQMPHLQRVVVLKADDKTLRELLKSSLTTLMLHHIESRDLDLLADINSLRKLTILPSKPSPSYAFLRRARLRQLSLYGVTDNSVGEALEQQSYDALELTGAKLKDYGFLRTVDARYLNLSSSTVKNISWIRNKIVNRLDLGRTEVADLSPLAGLPLNSLDLGECDKISSLAPLQSCRSLEHIVLPKQALDYEVLLGLTALKRIGFNGRMYSRDEFMSENLARSSSPKVKSAAAKEQGQLAGAFTFAFEDLQSMLVRITHGDGEGTGFLAKDPDGSVYVYTNQNLIQGAGHLRFTTFSGKDFKVSAVQFGFNRNVVRFKTSMATKLVLETRIPMNRPIMTFAAGKNEGEYDTQYGSVGGIGPDRVEVSAQFGEGSAGMPIIDPAYKVVGIASYATQASQDGDWVRKGTRFEDQRYFGLRLDGVKWWKCSWKNYTKLSALVQKDYQLITEAFKLGQTWLKDPVSGLVIKSDYKETSLHTVILAHNNMVAKVVKYKSQKTLTPNEMEDLNRILQTGLRNSFRNLSRVCSRREASIKSRTRSQRKKLTPFMIKQMEANGALLKHMAGQLEHYGDQFGSFNFFRFAEEQK